jgi:hypothetical protein
MAKKPTGKKPAAKPGGAAKKGAKKAPTGTKKKVKKPDFVKNTNDIDLGD